MKYSMVAVCLVITFLSGYTQCNKVKKLKRKLEKFIGSQTLASDEFNDRLKSVEKALNESTERTKCCDSNIQSNDNPTSQDTSESFVNKDEFLKLAEAFKEEKAATGRMRRQAATKMKSLDKRVGNVSHDFASIRADMCTATELHTINTVTESVKRDVGNISQEVQITKAEIAVAIRNIDKVEESLGKQIGDVSETITLIKSEMCNTSNLQLIMNVINLLKDEFEIVGKSIKRLSERMGEMEKSSSRCSSATKTQVYSSEIFESTVDTSTILPKLPKQSCHAHYEAGNRNDGVYTVYLKDNDKSIDVYCDLTTDGGGWTVFQRRKDGSVDFYRDWQDYKQGFGDLRGEFWLGNDNIAALTNPCCRELRIELEDSYNKTTYEKYGQFNILPEHENYKLYVDLYSGNAGDSLKRHNNMSFSTKDRDNDITITDCANAWKGGWWYESCYRSNLNGLYGTTQGNTLAKIKQYNGKRWEYPTMTEMKLR